VNPEQIWTEDGLLTEDDGLLRLENASGRRETTLKERDLFSTYDQGKAYLVRRPGEGKRSLLVSADLKHWQKMVELPNKSEMPLLTRVLPLRNGRFWALGFPHVQGAKASPVVILGPSRGDRLAVVDVVELRFHKPVFTPVSTSNPAAGYREMKGLSIYDGIALSQPLLTEDFIILLQPHLGHFLVFSREDGRLLRTAVIFSSLNPESLEREPKKAKEYVVVGAQPLREGRILVATRCEAAVLLARVIHPDKVFRPSGQEGEEPSITRLGNDAIHTESLKSFPEILWWEFTPSSGALAQVPAPSGLPASIADLQIFKTFRFRSRLDGGMEVVNR
jgi:hypothetical protein